MSSYIYMKILESQPHRYDAGISWLSFGQAPKIKQRIVDELVSSGMNVLEIGCGTGTLAVMAAKKGARVTGFDVSANMLEVAGDKIHSEGLDTMVELNEMGVSGMDHFQENSFDLVASTLVFSELSSDEQRYALKHAKRALKPEGRLVIADEVRPRSFIHRLLHTLVRLPMLIITFILTQTTTKAVEGAEDLIREAGFKIEKAERRSFDSFLYLVASVEKTG